MEHPLRKYRDENALRPGELAGTLGISAVQLWRLENGHRDVTPEMAVKIEQQLGIPRWQLRPDLWDEPAPITAAASEQERIAS